MEELDYYKIHDVDAMVFYFSRVNGARLVLQIHTMFMFFSSQPIKYQYGMVGLLFG
jgi:hypothetical protein